MSDGDEGDVSDPERPMAAFDPLAEAKRLLRGVRAGSLATLSGSGAPFASLVTLATDHDGAPLILVSQLSAHTRHLDRDARCSLLLAEGGAGDPLSHPRLTVTGAAVKVTDPEARRAVRARFLARHPAAELYADFGDFSFWRVAMDQAHLNGGFARAAPRPPPPGDDPVAEAGTLIAAEAGAIAHMNGDHAEALDLYARVIGGRPGGAWVVTGIDPDGLDLSQGDLTARIPFPERVLTPGDLRGVLVRMADAARRGEVAAR